MYSLEFWRPARSEFLLLQVPSTAVASTSSRSLLEMQNLKFHPNTIESRSEL